MNRKLCLNPFLIIAGMNSFLLGLMGLLLTSYIAYKTGTHFNGLANIDFAKDSDFWVYLFENCSHWIILSILLFAAGLLLSTSRIRVIDIFGTTLFSRIPLIITPLIRTLKIFQSFVIQSVQMYFLIGVYLISMVWTIVLLFNAYKVSCNLKNERLIISFAIVMIVSEILTKILLHIIIKSTWL
jgi:hypothetical protein